MELKSLRLLVEVANTGSFVAAAERCHTVQSNVTAHVKKLESELGVQLVQRKGGARLTSAGQSVLEYAKRMLADHDELLSLFNEDKLSASRLRIGAMETTTAVRLPPILNDFYQRYPDVNLTVETAPSGVLLNRLMAAELDGVFVAGQPEHRQLQSLKVFSEELVLVGRCPLVQLPGPEQLLESAFLAFRQGCSYRQRIELLLASQGVNAARIFEFGSIDGILGCVAAGMGFTLMPRSVAEAYQGRFEIDVLPIDLEIGLIDTYFVSAATDSWPPALARFVDAIST